MSAPLGAPGKRGRQLSRRLPPLAMGVAAIILMVAVLPSSLHVPITGPNGQAEVAPVPGQGQNQSSLSQLGLADSDTTGTGGSGALVDGSQQPESLADLLDPLNPGRRVAQQANCFGRPARQTEDPLSPPCVPSWSGDNGGSTYGARVSRNVVTVMLVNGNYGHNLRDYSQPSPEGPESPYDTTARLLTQYFNKRFQRYGRTVRVIAHRGTINGVNPDIKFGDIDAKYHPFAVVAPFSFPNNYAEDAIKAGAMVFTGTGRIDQGCTLTRARMIQAAPLVWCFNPAQEDMNAAYAQYICHGLVGRPASQAGDASMRLQTRKFAIMARGSKQQAQPNVDALNQACGLNPDVIVYNSDPPDRTSTVAALIAGNYTSILNPEDNTMSYAARQQYTPEWIFNRGSLEGGFQPQQTGQVPATEWNSSFGIVDHWRWKSPPQPYWWQAAREIDPSVTPDTYLGSSIYYGLLAVFTAIQRAGPQLTPANVGSQEVNWTPAFDPPYSPLAGFAPGDPTFVHSVMIVKWDSTGSAPGGSPGKGCLRLPDDGQLYPLHAPFPDSDRVAAIGPTTPCQPSEVDPTDGPVDSNNT